MLRGMHYQWPQVQGMLMTVLTGLLEKVCTAEGVEAEAEIEPIDAFVLDSPDHPSDHRAVALRFVLK